MHGEPDAVLEVARLAAGDQGRGGVHQDDVAPRPRLTVGAGLVEPQDNDFSAFVFKIQANMDPNHRDRIAFARVASGRFQRGMQVQHVRTEKKLTLARSIQFMGQDRVQIEEAFAGDVIGLWDPGVLRIGDSLCEIKPHEFEGIPRNRLVRRFDVRRDPAPFQEICRRLPAHHSPIEP